MRVMYFPNEEGKMHVLHARDACGGKVYADSDGAGHFLVCSGCGEEARFDELDRLFMKTYLF